MKNRKVFWKLFLIGLIYFFVSVILASSEIKWIILWWDAVWLFNVLFIVWLIILIYRYTKEINQSRSYFENIFLIVWITLIYLTVVNLMITNWDFKSYQTNIGVELVLSFLQNIMILWLIVVFPVTAIINRHNKKEIVNASEVFTIIFWIAISIVFIVWLLWQSSFEKKQLEFEKRPYNSFDFEARKGTLYREIEGKKNELSKIIEEKSGSNIDIANTTNVINDTKTYDNTKDKYDIKGKYTFEDANCQKYVSLMECLVEKTPEEGKASTIDAFSKVMELWNTLGADQLPSVCKEAMGQLTKQSDIFSNAGCALKDL